ncbi:MAG TPA: hypothetical protein VGG61_14120 [Gemmataceae bacterium]
MRSPLLPLALVALLASVHPSRGEFDRSGGASMKPTSTQSAFAGMANRRPAQKPDVLADFLMLNGNLVFVPAQFPVRLLPIGAKEGARVKLIHRPANIPSQPYAVNPIEYFYWDGALTK